MRRTQRLTARQLRERSRIIADLRRVSAIRFVHTAAIADPESRGHMIARGIGTVNMACDGKVRFATFERAEHGRVDLERRHGKALETYACPFCASYHFSTKRGADPAPVVTPIGYRFPDPQPLRRVASR